MCNLSLAAPIIFFNTSKVIFILALLLSVSLFVFLLVERVKTFHALAAFGREQEDSNLVYLRFQETTAYNRSR
ncbi:hypothetical protein ACFX13_036712 [Malus domestica]